MGVVGVYMGRYNILTNDSIQILTPMDLCFHTIEKSIERFIPTEYLITPPPPHNFGVVEECIFGVILSESQEIQLRKPGFKVLLQG